MPTATGPVCVHELPDGWCAPCKGVDLPDTSDDHYNGPVAVVAGTRCAARYASRCVGCGRMFDPGRWEQGYFDGGDQIMRAADGSGWVGVMCCADDANEPRRDGREQNPLYT